MPQRYFGSDLVLLAALISIILSDSLATDDINILSGLFNAIGENLSIIATKKQLCQAVRD